MRQNPTYTELLLLGALRAGRSYGLALAEFLELDKPMTYTCLNNMVRKGYLVALPENIDQSAFGRRARTYYDVTPAGVQLFESAADRIVRLR